MIYIQELKSDQNELKLQIKECADGNTQLLKNQLERNTIVPEKLNEKF